MSIISPKLWWKQGRAWFTEQAPAVQEKLLGKGKYQAWRGKQIGLDDLAHRAVS